jgi:hypothetical protein
MPAALASVVASLVASVFTSVFTSVGSMTIAADPPGDAPATAAPVIPPAVPPEVTPEPVPSAAPSQTTQERVDAFLDEIECTGARFESLAGDIAVETVDTFADSQEFRSGRVVVEGKGSARRIALVVDRITIDGRTTKAIDHYLFADGWYSRLDHRNRSFTRRRLAAEGAEPDALESVGDQFPLPIGVRKKDILARFEVSEAELPADVPLLATLANVTGLRLVPRAETAAADKTAAIEVFYDRATIVPVGVVVRSKVAKPEWAKWTAARVAKPAANEPLSDADRALLVVPTKAPEGWAVVDE